MIIIRGIVNLDKNEILIGGKKLSEKENADDKKDTVKKTHIKKMKKQKSR